MPDEARISKLISWFPRRFAMLEIIFGRRFLWFQTTHLRCIHIFRRQKWIFQHTLAYDEEYSDILLFLVMTTILWDAVLTNLEKSLILLSAHEMCWCYYQARVNRLFNLQLFNYPISDSNPRYKKWSACARSSDNFFFLHTFSSNDKRAIGPNEELHSAYNPLLLFIHFEIPCQYKQ